MTKLPGLPAPSRVVDAAGGVARAADIFQDDEIPVVVDVDPSEVIWPIEGPESVAGTYNWEFVDLSSGVDWSIVDDVLEVEAEFVRWCVAEVAQGRALWDAVDHARDEMAESLFCIDPGLDLGVNSAALALNAIGCPTYISCNGHGRSHAYVDFFARERHVRPLIDAATSSGVGLANCHGGGLAVYTGRIDGLVKFAEELARRYRPGD